MSTMCKLDFTEIDLLLSIIFSLIRSPDVIMHLEHARFANYTPQMELKTDALQDH